MSNCKRYHREIVPLTAQDSFLVFDRTKDEYDLPVHYHPEFQISLFLNGKGLKRIVGDCREEVGNIDLILVGPNLLHGWEQHNCKSNNIHVITIQFDGTLFHEFLLSKRTMAPIKKMFNRSAQGISFSNKVARTLTPRLTKLSKLDVNGMDYFLEIISILSDLANSPNQRLLSTLNVEKAAFDEDDKMKSIFDYVQKNFSQKILLDEAANAVSMTTTSFNRFIKKRTGNTFVNYINDIRLGYATKWLVEKDLTISEIAFRSGFNNIANFNRSFKAFKKCTPSQYRDRFLELENVL
ncbi:AraC family transcriptional regulator [Flavobacterium sp.]|uniref:AraC family transcriptional regulator n=1 Tax=Flavobacterium sp. TaxID=239 RepID=UPI002BCF405F|nr:AraC family transcriptional regulator [Flavobacterium sp.]HSD08508.1 AraC family transcriptional regulator [Flavobacterium sp.]